MTLHEWFRWYSMLVCFTLAIFTAPAAQNKTEAIAMTAPVLVTSHPEVSFTEHILWLPLSYDFLSSQD